MSKPCGECGKDHIFPKAFAQFPPWGCDECYEKELTHRNEEERQESIKRHMARFKESVPPIYHETDKSRLDAATGAAIDAWEYNPIGIGIIGKSGKGKTRFAVELLKRMTLAGKRTMFLPATEFANACSDQFSNDNRVSNRAEDLLHLSKSCELLLFDDLGKNRMTDRAESSLYELLETRTSHRRPTVWTSNSNGDGLFKMFSQDRADPILRRLIEFSKIYTL
jgi:DNA replication protein DnaC